MNYGQVVLFSAMIICIVSFIGFCASCLRKQDGLTDFKDRCVYGIMFLFSLASYYQLNWDVILYPICALVLIIKLSVTSFLVDLKTKRKKAIFEIEKEVMAVVNGD